MKCLNIFSYNKDSLTAKDVLDNVLGSKAFFIGQK